MYSSCPAAHGQDPCKAHATHVAENLDKIITKNPLVLLHRHSTPATSMQQPKKTQKKATTSLVKKKGNAHRAGNIATPI
jgi:uncharacterized Zn finger protein